MTIATSSTIGENQFVAKAAKVLTDPAAFAESFLQQDLWSKQIEILRAVMRNELTACKACHASGKTFTAAQLVLYWLARYPDGKVITTAPTWTQVEKNLWGDIDAAVRRSVWPFPEPNKTELMISRGNYALGLSTNDSDRFQGFHGNNILVIVDEAPGLRPLIYQAIDGVRAGGNVRLLLLGNPTLSGGRFYDAFKSPVWKKITIDAYDTPNLRGLTEDDLLALPGNEQDLTEEQRQLLAVNPRPYLTTRRWVWEKIHDWGIDSPIYQSRVRGRFPVEDENSLFSLSMIEAARAREPDDIGYPIEGAVDVAGPGSDETVLYIRKGRNIHMMKHWRLADPKGALVAALNPFRNEIDLKVDAAGLGYHVWKHLKDQGFAATPVVAQAQATDRRRFANMKAEVYTRFRDLLEAGEVAGLMDETTVAQLLSIRYGHDNAGRVLIESKERARKRGVKSPDRAEALIWCFAGPVVPPLKCY